jgi:hypothetical protein
MPRPRRRPKPDRRRALELLASCRDGCTEAMMLAHGFTTEQVVELVRRRACDSADTAGRGWREQVRNHAGQDYGSRTRDSGKLNSNGHSTYTAPRL